jgi:hypothetical protein
MEKLPGRIEGVEAQLPRKYGLSAGHHASFEKIAVHTNSPVPVGSVIEGRLATTLKIGEPILFQDSPAVVSAVRGVEEKDGALFVHTNTSTYRLRQEGTKQQSKEFDLEDVASVETAKGSVYRYLPDGTTQRFKKVEGREHDPQAALVYVPDYAWVKKNAPPDLLARLGENEAQYTQTLLDYVHAKGLGVRILDKSGKSLESNKEIEEVGGLAYLAFFRNGKVDFYIPVSHKPKIGYSTFDTRKYYDQENEQWMRERHLGNKVVKINLKEKSIKPERG